VVLAKLQELNPDFDGKVYHQGIEGDVVTELCLETDKIRDITPVRALPALTKFCCCTPVGPRAGRLTDLSALRGLKLTYLAVCNNNLSDLSVVRELPLEELDCRGTAITDLRALEGMRLKQLTCCYTQITDLSPLRDMPLRELSCEWTY